MRYEVPNDSVDHAIFKHTAVATKKINVNPTVYRGGVRL